MGKSLLPDFKHGVLLDVLVVGDFSLVVEKQESERQGQDFRISFLDFSDPGLDVRDLLVLVDLKAVRAITTNIIYVDKHFNVFF